MPETTASAGVEAFDRLLGSRVDARAALRFAVGGEALFGDAHRDVADRRVAVVERAEYRRGHGGGRAFRDAREGDDGLVADLGPRVAQGALDARRGAGVADLADRGEGHLADVRIVVFDRDEEDRQGLVRGHVGEGDGGFGADLGDGVVLEDALELRDGAGADGVVMERVADDVTDGGRARRGLAGAEIPEACLEAPRERRGGEHGGDPGP